MSHGQIATPERVEWQAHVDEPTRLRAVEMAGRQPGSAGLETLRLAFGDSAEVVRAAVVAEVTVCLHRLAATGGSDDEAVPALKILLMAIADPAEAIRLQAVQGLGRAARLLRAEVDGPAVDLLMRCLLKALRDPAPANRLAAVTILGSGRSARTTLPLAEALRDPDQAVRAAAVRALADGSAPSHAVEAALTLPLGGGQPQRFRLVRHEDVSGVSGTGVVAEGVLFSSGKAVLSWCSEYGTVSV